MSAFTIAAAAPTVAPAKARVARSSIKARAAPVRRTIRTKATAEASADATASSSEVRVAIVSPPPELSTIGSHLARRVSKRALTRATRSSSSDRLRQSSNRP